MISRTLRAACTCLAAATFILPALPTMACGPDVAEAVIIEMTKPDVPPYEYAAGHLGIVLPTYVQSYRAIAYRYFSGKPLSAGEQSQFVTLWNKYYGSDNQPTETGDSSGWDNTLQQWAQKANFDLPNAAAPSQQPSAGMAYLSQTYQSYSNCYTDAYATAADTLRARAQEFGDDSPAVRSWVKAQIEVFQNCTAPGTATPDSAANDLPLKIRKDREYQIAAADLYGDDWDNAEKEFLAIAADASSQWRAIAGLVAARCEIRKGTLGTDDPDQKQADFAAADTQLKKIIADPAFASVKVDAEGLRGFVEFRSDPEGRALELSDMLARGSDPSSFGQDLDDYTKLMNDVFYSLIKDQSLREKSDMTDWMMSYRNYPPPGAEAHSVSRWQQTHSFAWLVAALAGAQQNTPDLPALLQAASGIPQSSPAYLTIAFQRDRLLGEIGQAERARQNLDRVLALPADAMSTSSRNLFLAVRMKLAANLNEFLHYSPRIPAEPGDAGTEPMFDDDAAVAFTKSFPLSTLISAVRSKALPDPLRGEIAAMGWTRAILLHDDTVAHEIAPLLVELEPELKEKFAPYFSSRTPAEREFAGVFILLHTSGLEPYVDSDSGAFQPDGSWWCPVSATRFKNFPSSSLEFLSAAQRDSAAKQWEAISALPAAPDWLIEQALAWAKAHPQDPRVPEALHFGVRATRHGCTDTETGELSQEAFDLLHRHYPKSDWTKQTPYWFR